MASQNPWQRGCLIPGMESLRNAMVDFSSRELAAGIWLLVCLIASCAYLVSDETRRRHLRDVFVQATDRHILITIALSCIYIAAWIEVLYQLKVWTPALAKDTVIWFFVCGPVGIGSALANDSRGKPWEHAITPQIGAVLIVEWVINSYTLSLAWELLLQPLLAMIVMLNVVARTKKEYEEVARFLTGVQALIGFGLLAYVSARAFEDYKLSQLSETLRSVLMPVVLSILLLPWTYTLLLGSEYAAIWSALGRSRLDPKFRRRAFYAIVRRFGLRHYLLRKFLRTKSWNLTRVTTWEDVASLLNTTI